MTIAEASHKACRHCGLATAPGLEFCCAGCSDVFELLMSRGLGHFYQLQGKHSFRAPSPVKTTKPITLALGNQSETMRFYLEGIHCLGCLWLLEKLPEIEPRLQQVRLDMAHYILEVKIRQGEIEWSEVLSWISRLGYSARPLAEESSLLEVKRRDRRTQLSRLGVAAFCSGNIMLLTVSIYAGADAFWSRNFAWLSAVLAVPVLTYSAWPLYRSALLPLRSRNLSIDLAIVLAIFSGIAMSTWSLLRGSSEAVYFDSMSMLVFLLLASRTLLQQIRESLAEESPALLFQSDERFLRRSELGDETVSAADLLPEDILVLNNGQVLPVDGQIVSTEDATYFDLSLLTGESMPVKHLQGDRAEAGSKLMSPSASFRVTARASESRLAKILEQIRAYELHRSASVEFADRIGRRFVVVVLALAALLLFFFPNTEGLQRALALAIVTCPCVLAFAIPLTLTRALQRAARVGILFRDATRLERLAETKNIFFDKTGTLTTGNFRVLAWKEISGSPVEAKRAAIALEACSSHPIARAILRDIKVSAPYPKVTEFRETSGLGVEGWIDGKLWTMKRSSLLSPAGENHVDIFCGGELCAEIVLGDSLRPEASRVLQALRRYGIGTHLLSGDTAANTRSVAEELGIEKWHGNMRPEHKAELVRAYRDSLMIGDGANDAVAFSAADVSVAMQGAVELSLRHCDILFTKPGLDSLPRALHLARSTMGLVKTNFIFTLAYNVVAGTLAILGLMSPLLAALLMPMSALTVFVFTSWQTSRKGFA